MFRYRVTKITFILLAICCLPPANCDYAQAAQSSVPQIWGESDGLSGFDCETTMMALDFVAIADKKSGKDQAIIIIARLGIRENSRSLIRRRLGQAADYLKRRVSGDKIITAEGERVRDLGQIEFYVSGQLHTVLKMKRNRDLVKGCGAF